MKEFLIKFLRSLATAQTLPLILKKDWRESVYAPGTVLKMAVHNGPFHADDVAAVVLKLLEGKTVHLVRTRDKALLEQADLVVDVGEGRFDHHNSRKATCGKIKGHTNCGASLLADSMGLLASPYMEKVFAAIAATDNGEEREPELLSFGVLDWVHGMNPTWNEPSSLADFDAAFRTAVRMAIPIMQRQLLLAAAELEAAEIVEALPENKEVVELPSGALPGWQEKLVPSDAKFVLYPSPEGEWRLQAVPPEVGSFEQKMKIVDPPKGGDFVFCHAAGFIAGWRSKASTEAAAKELLNRG